MNEPEQESQLPQKLEAILYLKAKPLRILELAELALCEEEEVEEALLVLMQDYALRDSALEVLETDAGFSLQLREGYMNLVHTIVPTDLGVGSLRTLAAIALKGPIPQTQLVELRGSGAYQHVGDLVAEGFVSKRRLSNGRSYSVQVTEKFYQYFEVDELPKLKLKKNKRRRVVEDTPPEDESTEATSTPPAETEEAKATSTETEETKISESKEQVDPPEIEATPEATSEVPEMKFDETSEVTNPPEEKATDSAPTNETETSSTETQTDEDVTEAANA